MNNVENRLKIISELRKELVGPAPAGQEIDASADVRFESATASYGPWKQKGSGEEILDRDSPITRYGVGVLFPAGQPLDADSSETDNDVEVIDSSEPSNPILLDLAPISPDPDDSEEFDLSLANAFQPSSMGVSFMVLLSHGARLSVEVTGGRYVKKIIYVKSKDGYGGRTWWLRQPFSMRFEVDSSRLLESSRLSVPGKSGALATVNGDGLNIGIEIISRPQRQEDERIRLLTVCIVNRTPLNSPLSRPETCLFQSRFTVSFSGIENHPLILPYPNSRLLEDPEMDSIDLLYRGMETFATGHGCAADWHLGEFPDRAYTVIAECLPVVDVPALTADITLPGKGHLGIPIAPLAGLISEENGEQELGELVRLYEDWVKSKSAEIELLPERYRKAAMRNMSACSQAVSRMRSGLDYLNSNINARKAFQLANQAMLLQQVRSREHAREWVWDLKGNALKFSDKYVKPDPLNPPRGRGAWRPFQIAFLLCTLESAANGQSIDRDLVELIWFPTGGGKTEAYLGLAAFVMFKRRLENPSDVGVNVLMRYTLRLLTAQQFQRACGLLCAMEYIRRDHIEDLGETEFSAGIWLGGATTPNTRQKALEELRQFEKKPKAQYPFLLTRCPWCGAAFGKVENSRRGSQKGWAVGCSLQGGTVILKCPDSQCDFSDKLPIYIIDQDIYERTPSLVLGTIDKFAMLAWKPETRSLFGIGVNGERVATPPELIIQDELHLISGPLGSLAGLYECVIEELCTDRRSGFPIPPKIVCSTATIRGYKEQIRALYSRDKTSLFPPPGLAANDSFFAVQDYDKPGRIYVGVHAVSLGSVQTEWVRTFTGLLQAPMELQPEERDPWWTMMVFFNSIREMGTAHTLFQSDIPDYARVIWNRKGSIVDRRYVSRIFELTSGLAEGAVASSMDKLAVECSKGKESAVDVCLASSIIEVGIDIPRLALMVVAGQPKTTSQYIQVTGRVGRAKDRPALIVTMYSPSKPRDRSHFEKFRSYHQRLYAYVEPTSVTPFSPPALERALHAVLVAYCRQAGDWAEVESPYPFPEKLVKDFKEVLLRRVRVVDHSEEKSLLQICERRVNEWRSWERSIWSGAVGEEIPLLRSASEYATTEQLHFSWPTLTSMRNVDAECEAEITTKYLGQINNA